MKGVHPLLSNLQKIKMNSRKGGIPHPVSLFRNNSAAPKVSDHESRSLKRSLKSGCQMRTSLKEFRHLSPIIGDESSPSSTKLCALRATSHAPRALPLPEFDFQITIHLMSNWGDPELMTLSEVDILGKDRIPLPNIRVTAGHKRDISPRLNLLVNRELVKETVKEAWSHHWTQNDLPIILNFVVTAHQPPECIRLWNIKERPEASLKDFAIYIDDQFIFSGECPMRFGCHVQLRKDSLSIMKRVKSNIFKPLDSKSLEIDQYGLIPIKRIKHLEIRILETTDPQSNVVGLNGIEFFNEKGENITFDKVKSISLQGATGITTIFKLMKPDKYTCSFNDMYVAEKDKFRSKISFFFNFHCKIPIVMIRVWNYNCGDEVRRYGVSKMEVYSNNCLLWRGPIKRSKGLVNNLKKLTTEIWLTEPQIWKDCAQITYEPPQSK